MLQALPAPDLVDRTRRLFYRWLAAEEGRFALWLPVCAMIGDAAYFALKHEPPRWPGAALLAGGVGLSLIRRSLVLHGAGLAVALFGFGFLAAQIACWRAAPFIALPSRAAIVTGTIIEVDALPDGARVLLDRVRIGGTALGGRRLRLRVDGAAAAAPGSTITLRAIVAPPAPPAYPGGRDLQRDDFFDRLAGYGYAIGPVTVTAGPPPGWLASLRARIAGRVRDVLPGATGAIAATLLTGLSAAIPPADRAAFRDAGLSHLLAIAGLHIGIVMGLVLAAARATLLVSERAALFWPVRQIAALTSLLAGGGYLLLTGMHVPIIRAFVMGAIIVLGLLTGRRAVSLRAWGVAALAVIALEPAQITGASFQLSFAAVLALIAGYDALREPLTRLRGDTRARRLAHHLATLALTSLLAGAASTPFIAYHFGRIQAYFILANLIAVPITALWIMPAGLAALVLMPVGLDRLALAPMGWGIDGLLGVAHAIAAWPGATLAIPAMPFAALLWIAAGLAVLCLWRSRLRWIGAPLMLAGAVLAAVVHPPDVLLSPDARLAGVRGRQALAVRAVRGGDAYVAAQWSQFLALPVVEPPCAGGDCRLASAAGRVVLLGHADSACAGAAALVVQQGAAPYCAGIPLLDREDAWQNGAAAIWLAAGRVLTDRAARGDRPWVFLAPEQQRARITLPLAPTEPLPPDL